VRVCVAIILVVVLLTANILTGCAGPSENTADWHITQADELNEQGRYDEAIEHCNKAVELEPGCADAYYNRGLAYKEQDKKAEAIADFEKFITLIDNPQWIEMARQQIEKISK
jgi:tetratricopeptide (TPR) repeat protein